MLTVFPLTLRLLQPEIKKNVLGVRLTNLTLCNKPLKKNNLVLFTDFAYLIPNSIQNCPAAPLNPTLSGWPTESFAVWLSHLIRGLTTAVGDISVKTTCFTLIGYFKN